MLSGLGCRSKRPRDDADAAGGSATSGKRSRRAQLKFSTNDTVSFAGARVVMERGDGPAALADILEHLAEVNQSKGSSSCAVMANLALRILLEMKCPERFKLASGQQHNLTTDEVYNALVDKEGIVLAKVSANSRRCRSQQIPQQIIAGWPDIISAQIIGDTTLEIMTAKRLDLTTDEVLGYGGVLRHLPLPKGDKVTWWTPDKFAKKFAKALVADLKSANNVTATPQWHSQAIVGVTGDGEFWICLQTWKGSMITLVPRLTTEKLKEMVRSELEMRNKKKKKTQIIDLDEAVGKVGRLWEVMVPKMQGLGPSDLKGAIDRLAVPAMGAPVPPSGAAPPPSALKKLSSFVPTCLSQVLDKRW